MKKNKKKYNIGTLLKYKHRKLLSYHIICEIEKIGKQNYFSLYPKLITKYYTLSLTSKYFTDNWLEIISK